MIDLFDISALVRGDADAWGRFVVPATATAQAAIRRALLPAGRADETGDVVQDFFVRLWKDDCRLLRRFDPDRAKLSTYLAVIAATAAIDHLRKNAPLPLGSSQEVEDRLPPVQPPSPTGQNLDLPAGLLTPRQALILQLTVGREISTRETADLLGINEQTVRSMRHKALTRLREAEADGKILSDETERG